MSIPSEARDAFVKFLRARGKDHETMKELGIVPARGKDPNDPEFREWRDHYIKCCNDLADAIEAGRTQHIFRIIDHSTGYLIEMDFEVTK